MNKPKQSRTKFRKKRQGNPAPQPKNNQLCARSAAAIALAKVLKQEQSLNSLFDELVPNIPQDDIPLFKALCFGVTRYSFSLMATVDPLLSKPIRNKDKDIYALLLIGIYQLHFLSIPDYAAIDSCVSASKKLKKQWAKGFLNATLRAFQKQPMLIESKEADHPSWLAGKINKDWPEYAAAILANNNQEPPLCLRVNQQKISRAEFIQTLTDQDISVKAADHSSDGLYVLDKSAPLMQSDAFFEGHFSVQDEAAQLAAQQFALKPNQSVLDACAAPGGKTCHLLEQQPALRVLAIDQDSDRLVKIQQNLDRLQLNATIKCADASHIESFWDGTPFDHILCDVPCSATGVIRRHPDCKLLRKPSDIKALAIRQLSILESLWGCLEESGTLLYTTCSLLKDENCKVIEAFLNKTPNARIESMDLSFDAGAKTPFGVQFFPATNSHDGFYFAKLTKEPS
ncbi:MAG: 16S rRNA (cytosine(967)-C(5))-methyltransferase RsmB [Cellvibrionales bacterium]|nr:16S rRNA (cytosine(967)-C(5))-methyltransferase RsmB [Cellvibrionales bacterium]